MLTFLKILLVLACGFVLGWFMLVPFCYVAVRIDYRACGFHSANLYIWLALLIPIGLAISWYLLSNVQRRFRSKATAPHRNRDDT